jgi:hypothetical protein
MEGLVYDFGDFATAAGVGLLSAICTGNPDATPADWENPLKWIAVYDRADGLAAGWPRYYVQKYGYAGAAPYVGSLSL